MRRTSLDELPQLFNVLKGEMSLVGPRPLICEEEYIHQKRMERGVYALRPGITGLAQIKGLRGDTSIQARIDEDINYIEHWSFWEDIRILILTPFCAVNRHEKYAAKEEEEEKKNADRARARAEMDAKEEGEKYE